MSNKKMPSGSLVIAGLAAFAYYKYSKMSAEQKQNLVGDLKTQAQKLYDQYAPAELKSMFSKKEPTSTASANSHFGEGNDYSS